MKEKEVVVHKPNQTITITSGKITVRQRKSYNILLQTAQRELYKDKNKYKFEIEVRHLVEKTGDKNKNYTTLVSDLKKLKRIEVETIKDNGDWKIFNLISEVEKKNDSIVFEFSSTIREALINNTFYTTLDLMILKELQGKYAVILYELAIRYHKVQIPEYTLEEFKELMGATNKSYDHFGLLKTKVIEPAVQEINEKTDIILSYETVQIKYSKKVEKIKFFIKKNTEEVKFIPVVLTEHDERHLILFNILPESERMEYRKVELSNLLKEHSFEMLKNDIEHIKNKKVKVKDFWAYFIKSTKSGHYSKDEIEKKKSKEEGKLKQQKLIEDENTAEELKKQKNEYKAKMSYDNLSENEIESYKQEYEKQKHIYEITHVSFEKFVIQRIINKLQDV